MIRTLLLSSALVATLAAPALAQTGPLLTGGAGDGPQVTYTEASRNIVGGGNAMLVGTADSRSVTSGRDSVTQAPGGLVGQLIGGGTERQLIYTQRQGAASIGG